MVLPATPRRFSVDEYLLLDRQADRKSEFLDGLIYEKAGASIAHNLIATNVTAALHQQLADRPCRVFQSDLRVKVADSGLYTYPDIVVACEPLVTTDSHEDTIENPAVVIEILSSSTEPYDRGEKFVRYQRIPSLSHYLLVAQDRVKCDHYARVERGWLLRSYDDNRDGTVLLEDLGLELPLADVYANVKAGS